MFLLVLNEYLNLQTNFVLKILSRLNIHSSIGILKCSYLCTINFEMQAYMKLRQIGCVMVSEAISDHFLMFTDSLKMNGNEHFTLKQAVKQNMHLAETAKNWLSYINVVILV